MLLILNSQHFFLGRSSPGPFEFRYNRFLLGFFSPVLRTMLCRGFKESAGKRLELKEVDSSAFSKVLELWSGANGYRKSDWNEIQALATVADRFQITEVLTVLEDAMMEKLSVEVCLEMLAMSRGIGTLKRLEAGAWKMATKRFGEVMATAGFVRIEEELLRSLLEVVGVDEVRMDSGRINPAPK